jgi:hypothetical protein
MNKTTATARPWKYDKGFIINKDNTLIASMLFDNDKSVMEINGYIIQESVNNFENYRNAMNEFSDLHLKNEALLEACREAQSYILNLKSFRIKESKDFHIANVLAQALNATQQ